MIGRSESNVLPLDGAVGGDEGLEWSADRTRGRGGALIRSERSGSLSRSSPQSFVTSHQNEYRELTAAASSLYVIQILSSCPAQINDIPQTEKSIAM